MLELCDYIYENYPEIRKMFPKWKILSLLDRNPDKIIFIKERGQFQGAAMYLRLSDEDLEDIIMRRVDIADPVVMQRFLQSKGDNIHFIYVISNNMKIILKGLRRVIKKENPHSVSWFAPDMRLRFCKFRRTLCLQSEQ